MDRRTFLKKAGVTAGAVAIGGCSRSATIPKEVVSYPDKPTHAQVRFHWRLAHSYAPNAPIFSEYMKIMADDLRLMTRGQLDIKIYGAGQLVPAFGVFDAVANGTVQMFVSFSYYWAGQIPAAQFTCSVPFGMSAQQVNGWFYGGGGQELWNEFYRPRHLIVFPLGNTGTQAGGWFRKEIKNVGDLEGLKIRAPGPPRKVYASLGATVVLVPGSQLVPAMKRGRIDAAEWVGPYYDFLLGLHRVARYYYSPGWHEPATNNELAINLRAWNTLPKEFQKMVEVESFKMNLWMTSQFDARNGKYVDKIKEHGTQFRKFPEDVLKALFEAAERINEEVADSDRAARKVYDSYKKFRDNVRAWHKIGEYAYADALKIVGAV